MNDLQIKKIEEECGWEIIEHTRHPDDYYKQLWTFWRNRDEGDNIIFIETKRDSKYAVCANSIEQWIGFKDYRNMLNYFKEISKIVA